MRVLLISANTETINMPTPPMGLACVASAVEAAGHEVRFIDLLGREGARASLDRALAGFRPEVIGVSIRNIDDQNMDSPRFLLKNAAEVVSICKARSTAPVVLGGAGYSLFPDAALDFLDADMGIQGEGERSFPALVQRLAAGADPAGVPGLHRRGSGCRAPRRYAVDLDRFPLPNPDRFPSHWAENPEFWVPVQARRGCPLACSYCSTGTIEGRRIRRRTPDTVVRWLTKWRNAGFRRFFFVDNTFNLPPTYAQALCDGIAEADLDIVWRCILYPGRVSPALVAAMARAGCAGVSLGFESGCADVLAGMNKRFSPNQIRRAAGLLADAGIGAMGFLLLGGPGETRQSVTESLDFVDSLKLDMIKVTAGIRIYPYTALAHRAVAEGIVAPEDDLLRPRFYMTPALTDWLPRTLARWGKERPDIIF